MKLNIKNLFPFLLLLLFLGPQVSAQYHLGEIGLNAGIGPTIPYGKQQGIKPSIGWNGNLFYSHWACGKNYGYHGSLGAKSLNFKTNTNSSISGLTPSFTDGSRNYSYLEAGFFFKLRKNEFHRRQEVALLAGAKLNYLITSSYKEGESSGGINDQTNQGVQLNRLNPSISVSAWIKRRLGKQSIFLSPGLDFMVFALSSNAEGNLNALYPHLTIGYSIWNSKQSRFTK